jgi:hypothetical protein
MVTPTYEELVRILERAAKRANGTPSPRDILTTAFLYVGRYLESFDESRRAELRERILRIKKEFGI